MRTAALLLVPLLLATTCAPEREPSAENAGEPWASLRAMGDSLHRAAAVGEGARAAGGDRENADGGRHLAEILLNQTRRQVFAAPDPVPAGAELADGGLRSMPSTRLR